MARKPLTERQLRLQEALANLKTEKTVLKEQRLRVAAAQRVVTQLSRCDGCGVRVQPTGADDQLCLACAVERIKAKRQVIRRAAGYA
jgi:hypothetical protein